MSEPSSQPSAQAAKAQRLRIRFARGPEAADIGHLDVARVWERALREAGLAVSYSQGKSPQPRITIAAGLPTGVTSEGELVDVLLAQCVVPARALELVQSHLPPGVRALEAWEVGIGLPSLPSLVRWAGYEVDVPAGAGTDVSAAIDRFLAASTFPWVDTRGEKTRQYDFRPLVQELRIVAQGEGSARLFMRLRCDSAGVGRPDQLAKALGLPAPVRIHRLRLVVAETSPAREAWRRRGRYLG